MSSQPKPKPSATTAARTAPRRAASTTRRPRARVASSSGAARSGSASARCVGFEYTASPTSAAESEDALPAEGHESRRGEPQVEQLGRFPEQVDGYHAQRHDRERTRRGRSRSVAAPQLAVAQPESRDEGEGVQRQEAPIDAQDAHERRRARRVERRLRVDEPAGSRRVGHALQEDTLRPARVDLPDTGEVRRRELEVVVEGEAARHGVVGRRVAPEAAVRRRRDVDDRGREEHETRDDSEGEARPALAHGRTSAASRASSSLRSTKAPTERPSASGAPRRDSKRSTYR